MGTSEEVDNWLRHIGRQIGHDLSFDGDGNCGFAFGDGLVGVVTVPAGSDDLLFYSTVATLPSVDRESMLERILRLNLHATATGGGSLGLEPDSDDVVLSQRWPWKMVGPENFGTLLGNFIALAMQLKTSLAPAGAVPPVESRQTSDLLLNLQWRA